MMRVDKINHKVRRILVIRFSAIGDVILTLPVLDALKTRFPQAEIEYVTRLEYAELVRHHPSVSMVRGFDKNKGFQGLVELGREIRSGRFELLIDLHGNLRSAYVRLFGGARMRRVYRKRVAARYFLKWFRINFLKDAHPVCDRYFTSVEDFKIDREDRRPILYINDDTLRRVAELVKMEGIEEDEPYLVIAPGASYPTKVWPVSRAAEAGSELAQQKGMRVVLAGGPGDREETASVARELVGRGIEAIDLAGRLEILESAALIKGASLLLTNDSGLMHAADALDRPLVAVFGPTTRELGFYPIGNYARVVENKDLACRPCTLHGDLACPKEHFKCMEEISVQGVVGAALEVI